MTKHSSKKSFTSYSSPEKRQCSQCVYKTKNTSDLRRHERRHDDVKFPCDVCNMPFMTLGHLGGHKRAVHNIHNAVDGPPAQRRVCSECDYTTLQASDMTKHKHKHVVNEYHCPTCNYPFGHAATLSIHMRKYHEILGREDSPEVSSKSERKRREQMQHVGKRDVSLTEKDEIKKRSYFGKQRLSISDLIKLPEKGKVMIERSDHKRRGTSKECRESPFQQSPRSTRSSSSTSDVAIGRLGPIRVAKKSSKYVNVKYNDNNKHSESTGGDRNQKRGQKLQKGDVPNDLEVSRDFVSSDKDSEISDHLLAVNTCKHCAFRTSDLAAFRRHSKRHSKGQYRCSHCQMPFLFKTNLQRHLENKHPNSDESSDSSFEAIPTNSKELLKCTSKSCKFVTYSFNQLNAHLTQHNTDAPEKRASKSKCDVEDDKDSEVDFSLDDKDPDLQFILDFEDDLSACTTGTNTDKEAVNGTVKISKSRPGKKAGDGDKALSHDFKQSNVGGDLYETKSREEQNKDDVKTLNDTSECYAEEKKKVVCKEEYSCINCNYTTFDKKFMRLHTTMHGYSFRAPKISTRNQSKDKVLGYKTTIVDVEDDRESNTIGNKLDTRRQLTQAVKPSSEVEPNIKRVEAMTNTKNSTESEGEVLKTGIDRHVVPTTNRNVPVKPNELPPVRDLIIANKIRAWEANTFSKGLVNSGPLAFEEAENASKSDKENDTLQANDHVSTNSPGLSTSPESVTSPKLLGRMTKEEFKRSRSFYKEEQKVAGVCVYECKICVKENKFTSKTELYHHFKRLHEKLRKQICSSCKYCSGPFPKLD